MNQLTGIVECKECLGKNRINYKSGEGIPNCKFCQAPLLKEDENKGIFI